MPIIQIEMTKGKSVEKKRALAKNITDAVVATLNCPKEVVTIIMREMEHEDFAKAGVLKIDDK